MRRSARPSPRTSHKPAASRPQLAAALASCRTRRAVLAVAKLDRLARNARFLLSVVEGSGEAGVVFCDLPTVPAVAELEIGLISQLTRAALAVAKARGVRLGNPLPCPGHASLTHAEWLALLLEHEISYRHDRRLTARLRCAKLRHQAAVEDVDYRTIRGLDRALFQKLGAGAWIDAARRRLAGSVQSQRISRRRDGDLARADVDQPDRRVSQPDRPSVSRASGPAQLLLRRMTVSGPASAAALAAVFPSPPWPSFGIARTHCLS